jgi:Flp pilus assembly protein TadB
MISIRRGKSMPAAKEKFATQVTSEILAEVRALAHSEGRQLQALVDEALADLIEKRKNTRPRGHVMSAYASSHENYAELYRSLAK